MTEHSDDIWLVGEFDGHYDGLGKDGPLGRVYDIRIRDGILRNAKHAAAPPGAKQGETPPPIRQGIANSILVPKAPGADTFVPATLHEFSLHDWKTVVFREDASSRSNRAVYGRVTGTAYGCLRKAPPLEAFEELDLSLTKPSTRVDDLLAVPDGFNKNTTPPAAAPDSTTDRRSHESAAFDALPSGWAAGGQGQMDPPAKSSPPAEPDQVPACPCYPVALMVATIVGLVCGWGLATAVVLPMLAACHYGSRMLAWLRRQMARPDSEALLRRIPNRWSQAFLPAISAIGLAWFLYLVGVEGCARAPFWPLLLPMLAMLFSVAVDSCRVRTMLFIAWGLGALFWCGARSDTCVQIGSTDWYAPVRASVATIKKQVGDFFSFDPQTRAVTDATQAYPGERRFSVDDIQNQPDLLQDCTSAIYFPDASLFPSNSAALTPNAEVQLNKLDALRNRTPALNILVTGHADSTGDGSPEGVYRNIVLSETRAQAVADWLIAKGWPANQIEARGLGSRVPLIDAPGDQPFNRRVEVRMKCQSAR